MVHLFEGSATNSMLFAKQKYNSALMRHLDCQNQLIVFFIKNYMYGYIICSNTF